MTRRYTRAEFEQVFNHVFGELMPGATPQGIHELSTTQRYQVGSRLQLGRKVYHYALVGVHASGLSVGYGCKPRNQQDLAFNAIPAAGAVAAGSMSLLIAIAATDGPAQNGTFPENYLHDGTIMVRTALGPFCRGIVSHPAKTAVGVGTLLLQLDAPTPVAVVAANQQEGLASPYANVTLSTETVANRLYQPTVGIPTIDAAAGNYTWIQTWGPCQCIGVDGITGPGGAIDVLAVYSGGDGGLTAFVADGGSQQLIGYTLASGSVAGGQGAPFVQLMIDP